MTNSLTTLISQFQEFITDLELPSFTRFIYEEIDWESRAVAVIGPRGVGKSTLLLQHYKKNFNDPKKCLYVLGDDGTVLNVSLVELAREFSLNGGRVLIIDEVHKYPNWSREIKNIYDKLPKLQLIISGSSNINITREKYDLSRRLVTYHLPGLSFREFINLEISTTIPTFSLKEILSKHNEISKSIKDMVKKSDQRILELFGNYFQVGYYPYFKEGRKTFASKLINTLDKVLHEDIPATFNITTESIVNLRKILYLVAGSHPFTAEITSLSRTLGVSRNSVYEYLDYLVQAELLVKAGVCGGAGKVVRKPNKLYLQNPTLYHAVGDMMKVTNKKGTLRESFAFNQLLSKHHLCVPEKGDIFVDEKYTLEIGGSNKDFSQLNGIKDSYLFVDDVEFGLDAKIPLYLLGFLY